MFQKGFGSGINTAVCCAEAHLLGRTLGYFGGFENNSWGVPAILFEFLWYHSYLIMDRMWLKQTIEDRIVGLPIYSPFNG